MKAAAFLLIFAAAVLLGPVWADEDVETIPSDENGGPIGMKFAITQSGLSQLMGPIREKILASVRTMKFPDRSGHKSASES